ncbi:hypothetical protein J2126_003649 [Xanthobacter flavus]|nr:hypothetical protein [Xanthobacter flavus]
MADPRNPLLKPVLRFTKDPKPEGITGGGKNAFGIKADRLDKQRRALGLQLRTLAAQSAARPKFNGKVVLYAAMFDDSGIGVHQSGSRPVGLSEGRGARLLAARQANGQRLYRVVQRQAPGGMPEHALVHEP